MFIKKTINIRSTCVNDAAEVFEHARLLCHTPACPLAWRHQHGCPLRVGAASLWRPWWRQQSRDCLLAECCMLLFQSSPASSTNIDQLTENNNTNYIDVWLCPAWWSPVGCVRTSVVFFAVCRPKYTEVSLPTQECPWIATPFSDWRCLIAFRRYSRSSREVVRNRAEIFMSLGCQISGRRRGHPNFWPNFINLGHQRSNMWQSLMTISQATSEIRRRTKVKI